MQGWEKVKAVDNNKRRDFHVRSSRGKMVVKDGVREGHL